ncbi:hypothetical protein H5410_031584 [Solanum commersonii]|uniref:Fucosyltransferase n=1 Tax=Solanum commersonii TaxID=4109 RepID=A0A9J5YMT0_SOLCO|nr:hypothetical protein H5410_031584 [Solanum commersonii]
MSRLGDYEALHKQCGPHTELYNSSIELIKSGEYNGSADCNYLVWISFSAYDYMVKHDIIGNSSTLMTMIDQDKLFFYDHNQSFLKKIPCLFFHPLASHEDKYLFCAFSILDPIILAKNEKICCKKSTGSEAIVHEAREDHSRTDNFSKAWILRRIPENVLTGEIVSFYQPSQEECHLLLYL